MTRLGTVKLPPTNYGGSQRLLGMSPDGRLRFLGNKRFMVSMWVHLWDGWVKEVVINVEHKVRSPHPYISIGPLWIDFKCSVERSAVVLLPAADSSRPPNCPRLGYEGDA
jgi:hypothetical protein